MTEFSIGEGKKSLKRAVKKSVNYLDKAVKILKT
jgi:hypothetical protein